MTKLKQTLGLVFFLMQKYFLSMKTYHFQYLVEILKIFTVEIIINLLQPMLIGMYAYLFAARR